MSTSVDLRGLALDRGESKQPQLKRPRHIGTRYLLPLALMGGFLSLVLWASWDILFPPHAVTVVPVFSTTADVQQEGTPLFQAAGWIEPRPTPIRVAALASGVVEELLVVENQPLEKGEPVAELIKDDARLEYESALSELQLRRAELQEAEAALKAARTRYEQPVHLEAALGKAEAELAKIETELTNLPFASRRAAADYKAAREDYEGKVTAGEAIAGIKLIQARSEMESAKAQLEELQNRRSSLEKERKAIAQQRDALKKQLELLSDEIKALESAEARKEAAQARVEKAQVTVAQKELQLERMTIPSPIEGRVYQLVAHPGARVGPGMTSHQSDSSTVITMYDPQKLQIRVDVRFENVPQVQLKQPVEIDNAALEEPIRGEVLFVSSEADIQKNTLQVKVGIPNAPDVFKPEMLVDVTFLAPERPGQEKEASEMVKLYIPQSLIEQGEDGAFVWLADQSEGVARRVAIETGQVGSNGLTEVQRGLTAASRVIASGRNELEEGDRVRVTGEEKASL